MKKAIIVFAAVVAAFSVAADRLYLEDFSICPGETMQVALILENERIYTAFQTDIILPQGLTILQEDDDYLFELSSRKASDHTFLSKMRDDGAIRVVCFSLSVKPFSGNRGSLLIINIKADEDFVGPAEIRLKNTFFTTLDVQEYVLAGSSAKAMMNELQLLGDANGDCKVDISDVTDLIDYLLSGCISSFHSQNADVDGNGKIDIADVTDLIDYLLSGSWP